jgi:hypothetical protein
MLFSAELLWCLVFVLKSDFQEKSRKILQKLYFARRPTEPKGETKGGSGLGSPPGGAAQAWSRPPLVRPPRPLLPPTYTWWPDNSGGSVFFPDRLPLRRHHQKPQFRIRNSVLAPCRDGDLEEIFITITIDVSPSTIHDSPIHVWVIPAVGDGDGRDWMRSFM